MYGQGEGGGAAQCRHGIWVLGLASHFSHWPARRGRARAFAAAACVANAAAAIERIAFWLECSSLGMTDIDRSALKRTSSCTDSVMSIEMSRRKRIVRVQEVQADTWRPMTMSMCSTGLSRETLLLPSVMLDMVIARAGACWRPPFDDLVQDVAPA